MAMVWWMLVKTALTVRPTLVVGLVIPVVAMMIQSNVRLAVTIRHRVTTMAPVIVEKPVVAMTVMADRIPVPVRCCALTARVLIAVAMVW